MLEKLRQIRLEQRFNFFQKSDITPTEPSNHWLAKAFRFVRTCMQSDTARVFSGSFAVCLVLGYGHIIAFTELMEKMQTARFNNLLLIVMGIYMASLIISGTFSSAIDGEELNKKFISIWTPIQTALLSALFLPVINNNSSIFSETLVWMLKTWIHFFPNLL
jgi:hypothetical protein